MISFYRYVRYIDFDPIRCELTVNPNGGIAFGFIEDKDALYFVASRCHKEDRFSKLTAKNVLGKRAWARNKRGEKYFAYSGPLEKSQDIMVLVDQIYKLNDGIQAVDGDSTSTRLKLDLLGCVTHLRQIQQHNISERNKYEEWIQMRRALDFRSLYAKGLPAVMSIDD